MLRQNNLDDMRFAELLQAAQMKISEYFPKWSDINTHDPGVTLIELFAWLTEQQRFYMNQSEEAYPFFPLLGITLRGARAAETRIEIPGGFAPREISENTPMYAENVRFETAEDFIYDGTPGTIRAIQRETVRTPIILGTAYGYPGESFSAEIKGQIILDFALSVSGEAWDMTDDFRASGPGDRHYTLNRETGEITFGDGIFGALPYGEIAVTQMTLTRGPDGNIAPDRISELAGLPVSQPGAAEGGAARETAAEALFRFEAERRQTATAEDIMRLVQNTPGLDVMSAHVYEGDAVFSPGKPRIINIAVKLRDGRLTDSSRRKIRSWLEPYRLICRDYYITEAKSVPVSLKLEIRAGPHSKRFKGWLETEIRTFFKENCNTFGAILRVSEFCAFVMDVPEVSDVTHCGFRVYGGAKISSEGDAELEPDEIAELSEVSIRIIER